MSRIMSAVKPPRIPKPTRRERAQATRLRITRVAYELFSEQPETSQSRLVDLVGARGVATTISMTAAAEPNCPGPH
jgi:hypothetical protein